MKYLITLLSIFFIGFTAAAQETSFSIQLDGAQPNFKDYNMDISIIPGLDIPLNFVNFKDANQVGVGIKGQIEHSFLDNRLALLGSVGYYKWNVLNDNILNASVKAIPIEVGVKGYVIEGLYGQLSAGTSIVKPSVGASFIIQLGTTENQLSQFTVSPKVGYELDMNRVKLDLHTGYSFVGNTFNHFNFGAGLKIPFQ